MIKDFKDTISQGGPTAVPSAMFTVNEFCAWARLSRVTAYKLASLGKIEIRKYGRKSLITRESAEAFISSLPSKEVV